MRCCWLEAICATAVLIDVAAAAVCNGFEALCSKTYSNVTFIGSHDSAFVGTNLADNQETSVADQLAQGVRFLQAQTHLLNNTIHLCHSFCSLEDAGTLQAYLGTLKTFLDSNANEVVTLLLTNPEGLSGSAFDAVFQSSGIKGYALAPSSALALAQWPTLGQMITNGQRLVVFMDFPAAPQQAYILNEFQSYMFETPFDTTDPAFPQCAIDRPSGGSATGRMILVNHFLDTNISGILIPNRDAAGTTNSAASIMAQANICSGLYGRNPNFILLDWISVGDAMAAQAMMNGLTLASSAASDLPAVATQMGSTSPMSTPQSSGTLGLDQRLDVLLQLGFIISLGLFF